MATAENTRFASGVVIATLALCAFFLAQGATAVIGARVFDQGGNEPPRANRGTRVKPSPLMARHDPAIILRRNIFNSELGDLTQIAVDPSQLVDGELALDGGETVDRCASRLLLRGTAVVPGDFDRSIAAIAGPDGKTNVYQGDAEVEGSRIRAIHSDAVFLQSGSGLCRLAMFDSEEGQRPVKLPPPRIQPAPNKERPKPRGKYDRNAGLTAEEIAQGIDKVNETTFNVRRTLLNKILDNAGKLIGIAAVSPKIENGQSIGMEIRGIRRDTLLEKLGVKNNDILESVNGQPLSNPDAALGAYTTLRTADKFNLSVIRDGKPVELNYTLN